jgi:CheY-like chemotaxis protein
MWSRARAIASAVSGAWGAAAQARQRTSGKEAVAQAGSGRWDLILMDVQMPEMDGLDATRAIRRLPGMANTPILAMTGNAYEADLEQCRKAGMNGHIGKPASTEVLHESVLHWLRRASGASQEAEAALLRS